MEKNKWRKFDHILLVTRLRPACDLFRRDFSGRFTLNQIYSLIFEVPKGVMPESFDAAA